MTPSKSAARRPAFWITLARSVLALTLGLALILEPEKSRPMLVNFIGMFWFMADLPHLFDLLGTGKLKPRIGAKFLLLEAANANELLESGRANGRIAIAFVTYFPQAKRPAHHRVSPSYSPHIKLALL